MNKILNYVCNKQYRFGINNKFGLYSAAPDKKFLEKAFKVYLGQELNLNEPTTFNEKLQWLKLYNRKPEYTIMVDKYKVRDYIKEKIGERYLIPLIGAYDSSAEVDFDKLPDKFVLKCNHNSGLGMYICKDKSKLTTKRIREIRKNLDRGLRQDYYLSGREWPYKDVPRKIIAEQYMESDAGGLTDYKIHCFNGEPKFILVCKDRFAQSGLTEDFFSTEWERLDVRRPNIPNSTTETQKPEVLNEMLEIAKKLSADIPFLRVDFYVVSGRAYFSELTFFPASGLEKFEPERWDKVFGEWLSLPLQ